MRNHLKHHKKSPETPWVSIKHPACPKKNQSPRKRWSSQEMTWPTGWTRRVPWPRGRGKPSWREIIRGRPCGCGSKPGYRPWKMHLPINLIGSLKRPCSDTFLGMKPITAQSARFCLSRRLNILQEGNAVIGWGSKESQVSFGASKLRSTWFVFSFLDRTC